MHSITFIQGVPKIYAQNKRVSFSNENKEKAHTNVCPDIRGF
jgi:hypothetical protein